MNIFSLQFSTSCVHTTLFVALAVAQINPIRLCTHIAIFVELVVGELELVETGDLRDGEGNEIRD